MHYYAHPGEPVISHLQHVARLCRDFASEWGAADEAFAAGMLHDVGKYSELFQKVLSRAAIHVDHATPGSLLMLKRYRNEGFAAALAVEGHHDGLIGADPASACDRIAMRSDISTAGKRYSDRDIDALARRFELSGGSFPNPFRSGYRDVLKGPLSAMMYVRMIYSALTDADFLAAEAYSNGTNGEYHYRPLGLALGAERARLLLECLQAHVQSLRETSTARSEVNSLRDDLFEACLRAGDGHQGIYTLTAPTGSGKTLSMLAFALTHARRHDLRRIIFVLPFLNLIEEMASSLRRVAAGLGDEVMVLEDHSLSDSPKGSKSRLLAENWDAPIVVTTTVKLFESLFANRSTSCRKLHNIARSIIMFDEAQSMPPRLAPATLGALAELNKRYGCTVVFSTATQPAFRLLDDRVKQYTTSGWAPQEIVPRELSLFDRAQRVRVFWHKGTMSWEDLVDSIADVEQALVVVNLRSHAKAIYRAMSRVGLAGRYHLSTDMCPAHRADMLEKIRRILGDTKRQSCRLISTQCVEAGVDIDFPVVYRSMAPLESIVQAAGRCNRNGKEELGEVHVFAPLPEEERYPTTDYQKGAIEVKQMLASGDIDIYSTDTLNEYYERYYAFIGVDGKDGDLRMAIDALDFEETDRRYEWIPRKGVNILVPYRACQDRFERLCEVARSGGVGSQWLRDAQPLSVNLLIRHDSALWDYLEPVVDREGIQTGWHILLEPRVYSDETGIDPYVEGLDDRFCVDEDVSGPSA